MCLRVPSQSQIGKIQAANAGRILASNTEQGCQTRARLRSRTVSRCASKRADRCAPGRGGENHVRREQRTPVSGGGAVLRRAADEFVGAVEVPDQAGGAEPRNGGVWENEGVARYCVCAFDFHAASMAQGVGRRRSKAKINSCGKPAPGWGAEATRHCV